MRHNASRRFSLRAEASLVLGSALLASCSFNDSSSHKKTKEPVAAGVTLKMPPLPDSGGLALTEDTTSEIVSLELRLRGEGQTAWQTRTVTAGASVATFEVTPGQVEVEARVIAANASGAEACGEESVGSVAHWIARGRTTAEVLVDGKEVALTISAFEAVPLVPSGVKVRNTTAEGNAIPNVKLVFIDPLWGASLPSACPGVALGQAKTDASGVARLSLPLLADSDRTLEIGYAHGNTRGRAMFPHPSTTNYRENLLRLTLDKTGKTLALVDRPTDAVAEFGASFFTTLIAGVDAENICRGTTVLGLAGTADCDAAVPPAATVSDVAVPACENEGDTDCKVVAPFAAVSTEALGEKIIKGQIVAGVAGSVPARPVDCAIDGAMECVATMGFPAVSLSSLSVGAIKKGSTIGGVTGDYPSADHPMEDATNMADLTALSPMVSAGTYEFFDSAGTRYTGSIVDGAAGTVGTTSQTFNSALYRSFTVPGSPDLAPENIMSGVSIFAVTGAAAPRPSDCGMDGETGCVTTTNYRPAWTSGLASKILSGYTVAGVPGSAPARPSDCASDGATNCVVPSSGPIKAADTTNFSGWDIRRKRNGIGGVLTFAGKEGQFKTCRNRANLTVFNNTTSPSAAGLDFFDTIDDYGNAASGLPGELPAWTVVAGGIAVDATNDFACGGIYATGDTNMGPTGADAGITHDPNGNWQDLTPGTIPGGSFSTINTNEGCNATDKHCVFRELISGLMVTERATSPHTWSSAVGYCEGLGQAGGVVALPIPTIGGVDFNDWRLPTQKELMQLSHAGMRGLNYNSALTGTFGNVSSAVWSSTTVSYGPTTAWIVTLAKGITETSAKTTSLGVFCVR